MVLDLIELQFGTRKDEFRPASIRHVNVDFSVHDRVTFDDCPGVEVLRVDAVDDVAIELTPSDAHLVPHSPILAVDVLVLCAKVAHHLRALMTLTSRLIQLGRVSVLNMALNLANLVSSEEGLVPDVGARPRQCKLSVLHFLKSLFF